MKLSDVHDFFDFVWYTWLPCVLLSSFLLTMVVESCLGPR